MDDERRAYMGIVEALPVLPPDKSFHLFVSYTKEDAEEVRIIVKNLEDHGIKCCDHERDFLAGSAIMENMFRGIRESVAMLVVLSEEFAASRYCEFEVKEALHLHITEGYALIPVKIEPCPLPDWLKHISYAYIDSSEDLRRVHQRIILSLAKKEAEKEKQKLNGQCQSFQMKKSKKNIVSFQRYNLHITHLEREKLWREEFEVSNDILDKVEDTVNKSRLAKYWHIIEQPFSITSLFLFVILLLIVTIFLLVLCFTSTSTKTRIDNPAFLALVIPLSLLLIAWIVVGVYLFSNCYTEALISFLRQERKRLNISLWDETRPMIGTLETTRIFVFYTYPSGVNIMKLNLKPCKDFFLRKLKKKKEFLQYEANLQELTDRCFEVFLRNQIHLLIDDLSGTDVRHHMATGAKCPCMLVEERVFQHLKDKS